MIRPFYLILALPTMAGSTAAQVDVIHSLRDDVLPLEEIARTSVLGPDMAAVGAEDAQRARAGLPWRFAIPNQVKMSTMTHGTWENLDRETFLWRYRVQAPGAQSINVGFGQYWMPDGGQLRVYSSDLTVIVRAFTAEDNQDHGELWTPALRAEEIVLELVLPADQVGALELELTHIGYGYRGFGQGTDGIVTAAISQACNVDVECPQGNPWREEIPSVGNYTLQGFFVCTGFLVNNVREDRTPFFMTAHHCGMTNANAPSLVVYWNYENSFCRPPGSAQSAQPGNGTLTEFNTGATRLAWYAPSDFTLAILHDHPNPLYNLTFSGWDATGADANWAVAIHHPSNDEKRISFENQPTTTTSYFGSSVPGNGTHVRVANWDLGTTEGGSSGSPLYNQDHRVIGQLHGGIGTCSSPTITDWYGKFSRSWTGGGTPNNALRTWLDPDNTGTLVLNTLTAGPTNYCTAKLSSCGTLPAISGSGTPSATTGSGFTVDAANTKALKPGLLMYSDSGRVTLPFSGGTLCVNPMPLRRTVSVVDTSGTPGQCNGTLSIDMNVFALGSLGSNPLATLKVPGTRINCQFWGRDTIANGALLSDALEYFVGP